VRHHEDVEYHSFARASKYFKLIFGKFTLTHSHSSLSPCFSHHRTLAEKSNTSSSSINICADDGIFGSGNRKNAIRRIWLPFFYHHNTKMITTAKRLLFSFMTTMLSSNKCMAFAPSSFLRRTISSTIVLSAKKSKRAPTRVGDFWEAKMEDVWRPDVNDVERISWGKPAKTKGVGSRGVPHRLNLDERFLFDNARRKGFLEIEGSGWRSQRREAPLLNTYRSFCDARGQASIVMHKGNTGIDELVVDISPLRNPEMSPQIAQACLEHADGGEIVFQGSRDEPSSDDQEVLALTLSIVEDGPSPWETRPIYQLPPYCISWELQRNEAKLLAKKMAKLFDTADEAATASASRKPIGVKPGKGRRHGGYGIG
jgi:hypothetical protein